MAFIYQVSFTIPRNSKEEEQSIGLFLERMMSYLRMILPGEPGYLTMKAMYSVDGGDSLCVLLHTAWENWGDLARHKDSNLAEDRLLPKFDLCFEECQITARVFTELD